MKRRFLLFLTVMLVNIVAAFGQTKISGTVIFQDDGEPVIGATVLVDGGKTGTVTDIDGKFTLLTSSSCHPKIFVKEFSYFLMPCHQHGLGVNLLVQR